MSRSTKELRKLWTPACQFEKRTLTMHSGASLSGLNVKVFDAFQALDAVMRSFRYVPRANGSGAWETGAYNCRKITGGTNWSLHAYGIAVDINARTNPYGKKLITDMPFAMVEAIKSIKTRDGVGVFRWGGDYRTNKDAMHSSALQAVNGDERAKRILEPFAHRFEEGEGGRQVCARRTLSLPRSNYVR